jgi:hypothetical protein
MLSLSQSKEIEMEDIAQRVTQRMAVRDDPLEILVELWGTYLDIELTKDSLNDYESIEDNEWFAIVGRRDLSFCFLQTTRKDADRLPGLTADRNLVYVVISNDTIAAQPTEIIQELRRKARAIGDHGWD